MTPTPEQLAAAEAIRHREFAHSLGGELYGWNGPEHCTVRIDGVLYDVPRPIYRAIADARLEVKRLRAALASSQSPCIYCSLPADEWAKCAHGFPGCGRADDAMGCPELGAICEREELRLEAKRLRAAFKWWDDYIGRSSLDPKAMAVGGFLFGTGPCPDFIAEAAGKKETQDVP